MIFFVAMPFMIGLMNFVVPLQLGVRDVAFPTLNSVGFWLTAVGRAAGQYLARHRRIRAHRLAAVPAAVGDDLFARRRRRLLSAGRCRFPASARCCRGVNLVTTILKMRAPGMTYMRMPMFCWTALASNLLIVAAFPVLTATLGDAAARPLPRLPFLHQRRRRQHDDVHEPHLGLGPSGGLHPHPAGVRRVLRRSSRPSPASRCSATARW